MGGASGRRERATREGGACGRRKRAAREGGASGRHTPALARCPLNEGFFTPPVLIEELAGPRSRELVASACP